MVNNQHYSRVGGGEGIFDVLGEKKYLTSMSKFYISFLILLKVHSFSPIQKEKTPVKKKFEERGGKKDLSRKNNHTSGIYFWRNGLGKKCM